MLQIQKAVKEQIDLRAAITGPTGGGKTYTALRMAFALVGPTGKVLVIDTERKSARKYATEKPDGFVWNFDVIELPDYSPSTYTEAIALGVKAGYDVIVTDSLSHAWEGEGGILEMQQKYGGRYQDWAKVNPLHYGLIDAILNAPCHMIVTMRSKMDYALETIEDAQGHKKTQVTKVGMAPIQRNGVQYEFDFILDMDNANIGRVDKTRCSAMRGKTSSMPGPGFFQPLIDWLNTGEPVAPPELKPHWAITEEGRNKGAFLLHKRQIPLFALFHQFGVKDWDSLIQQPASEDGNKALDATVKAWAKADEDLQFYLRVQEETNGYYSHQKHLQNTVGNFMPADPDGQMSAAVDHARQRSAEKATQ